MVNAIHHVHVNDCNFDEPCFSRCGAQKCIEFAFKLLYFMLPELQM